jgi:hypothetical protein
VISTLSTVRTAFSVTPLGQNTAKHVQGSVGNEPKVVLRLTTNSGDIHLQKE